MTVENIDNITILSPSAGKLLTNGDTISDKVFLGINDNSNNWYEVIEDIKTKYTAEQLTDMTTTELKAICAELGIATSMVKQNMIDLILNKQTNN